LCASGVLTRARVSIETAGSEAGLIIIDESFGEPAFVERFPT
jgi:hypothetical protein